MTESATWPGLGSLGVLSTARTRSISPENPTGAPGNGARAVAGTGAGCARDLGEGWKVSPSLDLPGGETLTLADISGPGIIQHIWITNVTTVRSRDLILRFYWDDQTHPSIEVPLGDFFGCGWEEFCQINSIPVSVNPGRGFNCFWEMPFAKHARVTLENRSNYQTTIYYQITYAECDLPDNVAYFHAQFRRSNPVPYKQDHVLLDGVTQPGHYVGTYLAWGVNANGWWGEGEFKFFLDGDDAFPTICGTGTEDYFGGSHNFDIGTAEAGKPNAYSEFSGPYLGMPQVIRPDGCYNSQQRFGMYRWHIVDPIRFASAIKITVQALGWHHGSTEDRRYRPLQDDLASVAFWYQSLPTTPFPPLAHRDYLEVR